MTSIKACVFDAYGTLFDVAAAARDYAAGLPSEDPLKARWTDLSETWRAKQLEYSWLRAADGRHRDFWSLTEDALDYAMEAHAIDPGAHRGGLLALYRALGAYAEAGEALGALKSEGFACAILSNGEPGMLAAAVENAGFGPLLDAVLSAEEAGVFKPSGRVYDLATARFRCAPREILFFSSNGWDVCSAAAYGFRAVWVNRRGAPLDRLGATPDRIVSDLSGASALARELGAA